ncbi:hypothetical protein FRB96_007692 [Tulasnella sp. 330]|nr:hypothetical protein FRB96_007692 [Tulasnella sp. 330]
MRRTAGKHLTTTRVSPAHKFAYLYLGSDAPLAPLAGFTAASMTLAKTMLYVFREYYCGWCGVRQNDLQTLVFLWIVPNG